MDLDERLRRAGQQLDDAAENALSHSRSQAGTQSGRGRKVLAAITVAAAALTVLATAALLDDRDDVVVASRDSGRTTVPTALPADLTIEAAVQRMLSGYVPNEAERVGGEGPLTDYRFVNDGGSELEVTIYPLGQFDEDEMAQLNELPAGSRQHKVWLGADDIDLRSVYLLSDATDVGVRVSSAANDTEQLLTVGDLVDVAAQLAELPAALSEARGESPSEATDRTPSEMPPMPTGTDPSQSAQDAARDGVHPGVAALPNSERSERLSSIRVSGGYWVLSQASVDATSAVGDPDGRYGVDRIVLPEYGEILLLDESGRIDKAYPMPGFVPSWIHVTGTHVYAGHVGDGALPSSSIVRIDRADLTAEVIAFPVDGHQPDPALGWETAPADTPIDRFVSVGSPGDITSWIGPVDVDLERIDELFDGS